MKKKEIFKDVPGYEDNYMCSNMGRVFSKTNRIYLKPYLNKQNKLWNYKLSRDGKAHTITCSKVVAMTWIENPNPKLYKYAINKNGDFNNYTLENVIWGTSFLSVKRKLIRHPELIEKFKPKEHNSPTQKMTPELVEDLLKYRELGYSCRQLTDIFPIKKSQIANIIKNHTKAL